MKRLSLLLVLLLGSVVGTSLQPVTLDLSKGAVSTYSDREKVVKKHILERISHVGYMKFYLKENNYYLGGGTVFPVKCVKTDKAFETFYLTARHNFDGYDPKTIRVEIESNYDKKHGIGYQVHRVYRSVELIGRMLNDDAALVKVETDELIPVFTLSDKTPGVMRDIYSVGYPAGINLYVSKGISSGPWNDGIDKHWKTSTPIWMGQSGGPIIDTETGKVVGIIVGIVTDGGRVLPNFSVVLPITQVTSWLEKVIAKNLK